MKIIYLTTIAILLSGPATALQAQITNSGDATNVSVNTPSVTISPNNNENQTKVRNNTARFDPAYFTKAENRHYMLEIQIDSTGKVNPVRVAAASGKMPYKSRKGGPVKVTLKGANNEVIDSYYLEDPTALRSCEDQKGMLPAGKNYSAFIPMPRQSNIATIEFAGALIQPEKLSLNISNLVRQAGK